MSSCCLLVWVSWSLCTFVVQGQDIFLSEHLILFWVGGGGAGRRVRGGGSLAAMSKHHARFFVFNHLQFSKHLQPLLPQIGLSNRVSSYFRAALKIISRLVIVVIHSGLKVCQLFQILPWHTLVVYVHIHSSTEWVDQYRKRCELGTRSFLYRLA